MPKALGRNLQSCFSVITKRPLLPPPPPCRSRASPSPPSPEDHNPPIPNLFKSYNSLFEEAQPPTTPPPRVSSASSASSSSSSEPDFATVYASQRFFFSSPGRSNSIVDSSSADLTDCIVAEDGVAVPTYSPDPYRDFRQSMQDMVDATRGRGGLVDVGSSWEYLHELLLSYLALNPKTTHKYIVCAFADLLVNLLSSATETATETRGGGGCRR
ncbi:unnamed protein product [Linum tenue]|uniref:Transcription repressor n=1 Tax=Linum tenue TaxID=586396 RepID=A0AAV0IVE9_9ROSI|nr:unnamed protein product [Linum tenue]